MVSAYPELQILTSHLNIPAATAQACSVTKRQYLWDKIRCNPRVDGVHSGARGQRQQRSFAHHGPIQRKMLMTDIFFVRLFENAIAPRLDGHHSEFGCNGASLCTCTTYYVSPDTLFFLLGLSEEEQEVQEVKSRMQNSSTPHVHTTPFELGCPPYSLASERLGVLTA